MESIGVREDYKNCKKSRLRQFILHVLFAEVGNRSVFRVFSPQLFRLKQNVSPYMFFLHKPRVFTEMDFSEEWFIALCEEFRSQVEKHWKWISTHGEPSKMEFSQFR